MSAPIDLDAPPEDGAWGLILIHFDPSVGRAKATKLVKHICAQLETQDTVPVIKAIPQGPELRSRADQGERT